MSGGVGLDRRQRGAPSLAVSTLACSLARFTDRELAQDRIVVDEQDPHGLAKHVEERTGVIRMYRHGRSTLCAVVNRPSLNRESLIPRNPKRSWSVGRRFPGRWLRRRSKSKRGDAPVDPGKLTLLVLASVGVAVALVTGVLAWRDGERETHAALDRLVQHRQGHRRDERGGRRRRRPPARLRRPARHRGDARHRLRPHRARRRRAARRDRRRRAPHQRRRRRRRRATMPRSPR